MQRRALIKAMAAAGLLGPSGMSFGSVLRNKYLVLIELSGANDGLNTLVPYVSDEYQRLRPTLRVGRDGVIPIGSSASVGDLGMTTHLAQVMDASWEQDMAVVTGVGYPQQNRSHFSSIALWETGSDGVRKVHQGWPTATLERVYAGRSAQIHGVTLNGSMGLFEGGSGVYVSLASLRQLRAFDAGVMPDTGNALLQLMNKRKTDLSLASGHLSKALEEYDPNRLPVQMRQSALGRQLRDVLRTIGADMSVPVMHVQQRSYDTHKAQGYRHGRLLEDLSANLALFRQGVRAMGRWDDVLVMTYCEFGRRVQENGNAGTDHGTANTHFLMGGRVNPGLYGDHPSLSALVDFDMQHTMDYRAIYDQVCQHWFRDPAEPWAAYRDPRLNHLIDTTYT